VTETGIEKLPLEVYDLGVIDYDKALELQRHYHKKLIEGTQEDLLLVCSHSPVFTCGTSTADEHIYRPAEELAREGSPLVKVERGGSVTYHGPEQSIFYPIISLHNHKTDVGWYMRSLEEVVIRTLSDYGITGIRVPGKTGVWLDEGSKIAFSGVRISRWCTLHGFSVNVLPCSERFKAINPCGLGDIKVVSIAELASAPVSVPEANRRLLRHFLDLFGYET
jgi:lipoate-protein ligase B